MTTIDKARDLAHRQITMTRAEIETARNALHMHAWQALEDYARGGGTPAMLRAEAAYVAAELAKLDHIERTQAMLRAEDADVAEELAHFAQIERTQRSW